MNKQAADLKDMKEASKHYQPPLIPLKEIKKLRKEENNVKKTN